MQRYELKGVAATGLKKKPLWPWLLLAAVALAALLIFLPGRKDPAAEVPPAAVISPENEVLPEPDQTDLLPVVDLEEQGSGQQILEEMYTPWRYYRSLLDSRQQGYYDQIAAAVYRHEDVLTGIIGIDSDELMELAGMVWLDYPEYFWMESSCSTTIWTPGVPGETVTVDLQLHFSMDEQQRQEIQARLDERCAPILEETRGMDDFHKVKYVYDDIINSTVYQHGERDQSLCTVLLEGEGVCAAYAKATQYVLDKVGIRNIYVLGQADGEGHAWNIVQLDGANYELDTTWGDPINDDGSQTLTYNYFCITTEEMSRNHTRDASYVLPTCTATDCNYFRHEGLFFDYYDIQILLPYLTDAALNGEEATLKFADSALLNQALEAMLGDAFELEELNKVLENEGCRVAVFWHNVDEEMNVLNLSFEMES